MDHAILKEKESIYFVFNYVTGITQFRHLSLSNYRKAVPIIIFNISFSLILFFSRINDVWLTTDPTANQPYTSIDTSQYKRTKVMENGCQKLPILSNNGLKGKLNVN